MLTFGIFRLQINPENKCVEIKLYSFSKNSAMNSTSIFSLTSDFRTTKVSSDWSVPYFLRVSFVINSRSRGSDSLSSLRIMLRYDPLWFEIKNRSALLCPLSSNPSVGSYPFPQISHLYIYFLILYETFPSIYILEFYSFLQNISMLKYPFDDHFL